MLTVIPLVCIALIAAIIVAFVLITRAENRYYEERKRQGKPTPWL